MRWGFRPCLRHTRATIMWLTPKCSASRRVLQCVVPSLGPRRVASRTRASSCGVSTVASWPKCRLYSPASRCSSKRRVQLATKPRLQGTPSHASSHVWPSASSKIKRARRASSARPVRLAARRSSSIRSTFVSSMASLLDAIIVYKWLLQSTRLSRKPLQPAQFRTLQAAVVESGCDAVTLGSRCLLPPLSAGGAPRPSPSLRFHTPLIEPDVQIARIRLSDRTSRLHPRRTASKLCEAYDTEVPVQVREWISPAPTSSRFVLAAQPPA